MAINAKDVMKLRKATGAGMMDCKKALTETEGDFDKAVELLQIKGLGAAQKKADRVAAEGLIAGVTSADDRQGVLVEVNSETDFVARNDEFIQFVDALAKHALDNNIDTIDALLASDFDGESVEDKRKALIATIGENITIRRVTRVTREDNGLVGEYVHNGNIGVLVNLNANSDVAGNETVQQLARDIAMHVAAMNPQYGTEDEIDAAAVEEQTRLEKEKALESGKPEKIVDKMVTGRIAKWKKEICLLSQPFVKDGDVTVGQEIERVAKETGIELSFAQFVRLVRGEGIEKKEEMSYAEEVAAALKG